jgi:hypothetical protein
VEHLLVVKPARVNADLETFLVSRIQDFLKLWVVGRFRAGQAYPADSGFLEQPERFMNLGQGHLKTELRVLSHDAGQMFVVRSIHTTKAYQAFSCEMANRSRPLIANFAARCTGTFAELEKKTPFHFRCFLGGFLLQKSSLVSVFFAAHFRKLHIYGV